MITIKIFFNTLSNSWFTRSLNPKSDSLRFGCIDFTSKSKAYSKTCLMVLDRTLWETKIMLDHCSIFTYGWISQEYLFLPCRNHSACWRKYLKDPFLCFLTLYLELSLLWLSWRAITVYPNQERHSFNSSVLRSNLARDNFFILYFWCKVGRLNCNMKKDVNQNIPF